MNILVDTNIIARSLQPAHPQQKPAEDAMAALRRHGDSLCVVPQVLYELWVVCTRPATMNGLGKTAAQAAADLATVKATMPLLADTPAILPQWEALVTTHAVLGRNGHDARLVAAMLVHGVTHLLTFNDQDLRRFTAVTVLTPAAVLAPPTP